MQESPIIDEIKKTCGRLWNIKTAENSLIVCGTESVKLKIHSLNLNNLELDIVVWNDCPEDTIYVFPKNDKYVQEQANRRKHD